MSRDSIDSTLSPMDLTSPDFSPTTLGLPTTDEKSLPSRGALSPSETLESDTDRKNSQPPPFKLQPNLPPQVEVDLTGAFIVDGGYYLELADGHTAKLTIVPEIQDKMSKVFSKYDLPSASFTAIEPKTGRVLALVSHGKSGLAFSATSPSASIFKIVTASALIEDHGLTSESKTCYRGEPYKSPTESQIKSLFKKGDTCLSFGQAFGESINPVFSSLAFKHLSQSSLEAWAQKFGFGEQIPFQTSVDLSSLDLSEDDIQRARQASGFRGSKLSSLHAALISASVANGGLMMRPTLIESIVNGTGDTIYAFESSPYKVVMSPDTAKKLTDMMVYTTSVGSASKYFIGADGMPPGNFTTCGKTGTLSDVQPYVQYSWFSGFAPVESPEIALSVLLHNPMKWRIKAAFGGLEGFKAFISATDYMRKIKVDALPQPKKPEKTPKLESLSGKLPPQD